MAFGSQQVASNSSQPETNQPGEVRYAWAGMDGEIFDESSMRQWAADEEEKLDRHRTKYIVDRRGDYLRRTYGHWSDDMRRIAMGVVLMSTTREANVQDQVHFLQLALGGTLLRTHGGQTFLYEDGAFRLFVGVVPEYMISRCKVYAECVEGGMWCIWNRGDTSRAEEDIFAAMDRVYLSISRSDEQQISDDVASEVNPGGLRRGIKRRRPWLEAEALGAHIGGIYVDDAKIVRELTMLTLDMWKSKESKAQSTDWVATEALNCQSTIQKIMGKAAKGDIIPYYDE